MLLVEMVGTCEYPRIQRAASGSTWCARTRVCLLRCYYCTIAVASSILLDVALINGDCIEFHELICVRVRHPAYNTALKHIRPRCVNTLCIKIVLVPESPLTNWKGISCGCVPSCTTRTTTVGAIAVKYHLGDILKFGSELG